jgi:hypothetical protein
LRKVVFASRDGNPAPPSRDVIKTRDRRGFPEAGFHFRLDIWKTFLDNIGSSVGWQTMMLADSDSTKYDLSSDILQV